MTINYKKTAWNDNASGYTPITPTRLNNIENALKSVCDGWDSVSQKTSSGWRYMLIGSVFVGWYAGNMTPHVCKRRLGGQDHFAAGQARELRCNSGDSGAQ